MVPAGTAHRDSKCRITSCCCLCLPIRLSLIRWKMCGSSCAATGSVIGCGKPTKPSSTLANTLGTSSCDCPSASLRSPHALGQNQSPDRPTGIRCDVVILVEDDTYPNVRGWERNWVEAAQRYGHANLAGGWFKSHLVRGAGTVQDPVFSRQTSGQV